MSNDTVSQRIRDAAVDVARVIATTPTDAIDPTNLEAVKKLVLDVLGAGVAGSQEPGCTELTELLLEFGGAAQARTIGTGKRLPITSAVAINGTMCRALEIDDVSEKALIHTTATVIPAAIAAAEYSHRHVSGADFLAACVLGIDVANRLSLAPNHAVSGEAYRPRGMSYTYQVGTFAAAATAARLWGLDAQTTLHALGLAYSQAAGNQQCLVDAALSVRVQQGLSASAGILAALMAQRGITGATNPLEGRFGYYPTYCHNDYDRDAILEGLGERFSATDVSIKPYPCCKFTHTAIAAALEARGGRKLRGEDIEKVTVHVDNDEYYNVVCEPVEAKQRPKTTVEAQFSIPYTVASALLTGAPTLGDFQEPGLQEPERLALAAKVVPVLGEGHNHGRTLPTPGLVEVSLADGTMLTGRCDYAPGHPANPMSWDGVIGKFYQVIAYPPRPLPDAFAKQLVIAVQDLENADDAAQSLMSPLMWLKETAV